MTGFASLAWSWLRRLLVITGVVMAFYLLAPQVAVFRAGLSAFGTTFSALERLAETSARLEATRESGAAALETRFTSLQAMGRTELERERRELGSRIEQARAAHSKAAVAQALISGEGLTGVMTSQLDLVFLQHERALLDRLLEIHGLQVQRQEQALAARHCEAARIARNDYLRDASLLIRLQGSPERRTFEQLDANWQEACDRFLKLRRAFVAVRAASQAQAWLDQRANHLEKQTVAVLQPLQERLETLEASWVSRLSTAFLKAFPVALLVLLALPLGVLLTRGTFYFLAQFASRRPPICLLRSSSGLIENAGAAAVPDRSAVSAVSQAISLDPGEELLVHPEYLQSSSLGGTKQTRWLLDWNYPVSSVASGMVALTCIRATPAESFVVSATRDAFSELGLLRLPEGSALAFQPHNLVGVIQPLARPLRITRHWRLGSLSAWLTLQLRYLVFHGPATLIVKGCRGIRVEPAAGGRSIDQSATIGFSANLEYSMTRCETFGAYLLGKRGLFNDHFAGGPGSYIYEEMPNAGRKSGITGRGLEGIVDGLRKAFGV